MWVDMAGVPKIFTLPGGDESTVNVTETPTLDTVEESDIYNFTVDALDSLLRPVSINEIPIGHVFEKQESIFFFLCRHDQKIILSM